ncbi:hypothetical protein [Oerskovia paurometabola]|uniref:hypothetical protein n=1 Tax=Oerskovia paurometabola TaxID=162170 RepID=UPI00382C92AB
MSAISSPRAGGAHAGIVVQRAHRDALHVRAGRHGASVEEDRFENVTDRSR